MSFETDAAALIANTTALVQTFQGLPAAISGAHANAHIAVLFVDPVNGSDAAVGTAAAPFKTIGKAVRSAPASSRVIIYLPLGSTNDIVAADCGPAARLEVLTQEVVITTHVPAGQVLTNATRALVRFVGALDGALGNVSPRFAGTGIVTFSALRIEFAALANPALSKTFAGAVSGELGYPLTAVFTGCALALKDVAPVSSGSGLLNLVVQLCQITQDAAGRTLLEVTNPTVFAFGATTLPAGVASASALVANPGGNTDGSDVPVGLLTNIADFG